MKGIDVSRWQGSIDWEEVGRAGVRFAMIKATEGAEGADPCFSANINGAVGAGIACGTYHYLRATQKEDTIAEADHFADVMDPLRERISLWAALDVETEEHRRLGKKKLTDLVILFCERVRARGYRPMLYTNNDFIAFCYDFERLTVYPIWLACWYDGGENDRPVRDFSYQIWQQGVTRVDGISGDVDNDYGYFALPETPEEIRPGDVVRIRPGSRYYGTDIPVPEAVLERAWIVESVDGDRVVIDRSEDGGMAIDSAVAAGDLIPVGEAEGTPESPEENGGAGEPEAPDGDGESGDSAAPPQSDPPAGETPPDGSAPDAQPDTPTEDPPPGQPDPPTAGQDADPAEKEAAAEEEAMEKGLVAFFRMIFRAVRTALRAVFGRKK